MHKKNLDDSTLLTCSIQHKKMDNCITEEPEMQKRLHNLNRKKINTDIICLKYWDEKQPLSSLTTKSSDTPYLISALLDIDRQ